jgi:hypothetical protein
MIRGGYITLLFAVPVLAVAGCGGDDSASEPSAARGASGPQDTTSTQTPSGATGTERARPKRSAKSKQRPEKETGADESPGTAAPVAPTAQKPKGKPKIQPRTLTPEELKKIAPGMREQARLLCKASGLEGLARQYRVKSGDPDDVAEAFAADYLVPLRDDVAAGCKAGLLEPK